MQFDLLGRKMGMYHKEKTHFTLLAQYKMCLMHGCASIIKYSIYSNTFMENLEQFLQKFKKRRKNG